MLTFFILLFSILAVLKDYRNLVWVYFVLNMWINSDIRVFGVSLMNLFFVAIFAIIWLNKKVRIKYPAYIQSLIKKTFIYYTCIPIIFAIIADGPLMRNLSTSKPMFALLPFTFAFLLWRIDKKAIRKSVKYIVISFIIVCLYGIYNYISESNPYMTLMSDYMSVEDMESRMQVMMADSRGALKGRITGTALYTIQYGIMIGICVLSFIKPFSKYLSKEILFGIISIGFVNIFLTGSRGPLLAFLISLVIYYCSPKSIKKNLRLYLFVIILLCACYPLIVHYIVPLASDDVKGSNMEDRSMQFIGALAEVQDSLHALLLGHGPYWIPNYIGKYGMHPLAYYFESVHIAGIVTYGILGLIFVFLGRIFALWYLAKKFYEKHILAYESYAMINALLAYFFIYSVMVGAVYEDFVMITYIVILKSGLQIRSPKKRFRPKQI